MAKESKTTKKAQTLTAKAVEAMKPDPDVAYRAPDLRAKGLALRVATDGGKTRDLAYRIKGKGVRRLSLGRFKGCRARSSAPAIERADVRSATRPRPHRRGEGGP
jgi:hypothetical protein